VLKLHANVRKALQYAHQIDMLPTNPADKVLFPKKKRFTGSFYDEQQIMQLLQLTRDEPMYPVILLSAFYGLRRSEVLGLKWSAIDFAGGMAGTENWSIFGQCWPRTAPGGQKKREPLDNKEFAWLRI